MKQKVVLRRRGQEDEPDPNAKVPLLNGKELLKLAKDNRHLTRNATNQQAGDQDIQLVDIHLDQTGDREEAMLAEHPLLYLNIRRGLTVLNIYKNQTEHVTRICRRGLKKFFDIYSEFISGTGQKTWVSTNKVQAIIRELTIGEVERRLAKEETISIVQTHKLNGENAQVSYIREIDEWVVGSKNCSLVIKHYSCLDVDNAKYQLVTLIGKCWLDILSKLNGETVLQVKDYLKDKTLVGEFCGHESFRHIVSYSQPQLVFYAVVAHDSYETCLPPSKSLQHVKLLGLPVVEYSVEQCNTQQDFYKIMRNIFKTISEGEMEKAGEGGVIYFEWQDKCLSAGKIKTVEYRLYRKLREKIRYCLSQEDNTTKYYKRFMEECKPLCQFHDDGEKLYNQIGIIAQAAFDYVSRHVFQEEPQQAKLQQRFINTDFMRFIRKVKESLTSENFEERKEEVVVVPLKKAKTIEVILPLTIPASGKTQFVKMLKQKMQDSDVLFLTVSSDEIRRELMDEYMQKNKGATQDVAFDKTGKRNKAAYEDAVHKIIQEAKATPKQRVLIFLDKNHPENALDSIMTLIRSKLKDAKFKALVPKVCTHYKDYPFSLNYLFQCISRAVRRETHETLVGSPQHVASVILFFFKFFRGKQPLQKFDGVIEFPFTQEDPEVEDKLKSGFSHILNQLLKHKNPEEMEQTEEIGELLTELKQFEWQFPTQAEQLQALN